jgi:hypothetical protein
MLGRVSETHGATLRNWLFTAVLDLGGAAPRAQVHARAEQLFGPSFTPEDRAPRVGRGGEPAWKNNLDSLYDRLKKTGYMVTSPHAGAPWRLSPLGLSEAKASSTPIDEADLLRDFKPKDGSEYRARFEGRVLNKHRLHESLLRDYGMDVSRDGWHPVTTTVHPRDLELRRNGEVWVVELKVVYDGNGTEATRDALAQLLEYRHFYYDSDALPGMSAVFSEPIGPAHVDLLESLGIVSVWRSGAGWSGSPMAVASCLVPATR